MPGPRTIGAHASTAWVVTATRASTTLGLGGQFAPEYRRYLPDSLVVEARFRLRTASYVFWAVNDHASALVVPGLLWQLPFCSPCTHRHDASDAADAHADAAHVVVLDLWHRVCECPLLEDQRRAALATAAARATGAYSSLASVFAEIAAVDPADARRQGFVFLATLGAVLYDGNGSACGLPARWAAALAMPRPEADVLPSARVASAAIAVTLPAFGAFARFLARPLTW